MQNFYSLCIQSQIGVNFMTSLENAKYDLKSVKCNEDELKIIVAAALKCIEQLLDDPKYLRFI